MSAPLPPRRQPLRANTDNGPRSVPLNNSNRTLRSKDEEENWELRHGWEDQYNSDEYLSLLSTAFYMYYTDKRHDTGGKPKSNESKDSFQEWRMRDRLKTASAALVLCLNIGVDPPDVVKTVPCATLECWTDTNSPTTMPAKTLEQVGKKLQEQYESLSIRVKYKQYLDPSSEETKKFCVSLRRNAKEERVMFHYNGHGVPLPTPAGEIWVFNKSYTQYIPVSLYDVQAWLGGPSLYVFDCSHAGHIVANFARFIEKHNTENLEVRERDSNTPLQSYNDNILLAACGKSEILPTNPDLPADLFTSCLTTPIEIAVRFFFLDNQLSSISPLTLKDLKRLPGRLQERRTPLGELNWIFTAITDTIAWNMLPQGLFKKLFRQDLMVAALFRNYLLSERIMKANHCHPIASPALPETHSHPLWQSWDLALEMVLNQLPDMLAAEDEERQYEYQTSSFFAEQLTAFEVYLSQRAPEQKAPDQLPIVLQVLLSQAHRLRALILLSRFLDLGSWAVNLALSIGIFPYVLKLLQSAAPELKPVMIFIWARILAVDRTCQTDLIKDGGFKYFIQILHPKSNLPIGNASEHRAMSAFIVATFCRGYGPGQEASRTEDLLEPCLHHLRDGNNPLLRQWSCLCISSLWAGFPRAKWDGMEVPARELPAHVKLCNLALDPVPEVRAAALHALTSFLGIPDLTDQVAQIEEAIASMLMIMTGDGNSMVRKELLVFFSTFVKRYESKFLVSCYEFLVEDRDACRQSNPDIHNRGSVGSESKKRATKGKISQDSIQRTMWIHIMILSVDPHPEIAQGSTVIVDYVIKKLLESPLGVQARRILNDIAQSRRQIQIFRQPSASPLPRTAPISTSSTIQQPTKSEGYLSAGMRRTASVAASLKHLAFGGPSMDTPPLPYRTTVRNASRQQQQQEQEQQQPAQLRSRVPTDWNRPPGGNDSASNSTTYKQGKIPIPKGFVTVDTRETPTLPLKSEFFEWSTEYFREPQMKPNEQDEPGSDDYNQRLWRRGRNEQTLSRTQPLKCSAGTNPWDVTSGFFNNGSQPMKIGFHQFEEHLVVADDRDSICIWNWKDSARLNRFSNGNPLGSKIDETRFINEDDQALLMTGSSDGIVKVFRNYESKKHVELVSAFRALTNLLPSNKNAGIVLDWQQGQGKLLVGGDVKVIRIWNAATEICAADIPARSGSCITSITSDQVAGELFVAGYGDGAIRVFDQRLEPADAMITRWKEHTQWITNVHMQRGGQRELVSASRTGEVKLWDLRMNNSSLRTITATQDTLRTLSVHEHAPVFATGSERHNINFYNMNGTFLNSVEPYSRFLQNSHSTPISTSAFHPHRMMFACAALKNNHINIFSCAGLEA